MARHDHFHDDDDQRMLHRAHDELVRVAARLTDEQRQRLSPCPPWTAADVIDHVAGGAVMAVALLGAASGPDSLTVRETWARTEFIDARLRMVFALERTAFDVATPTDRVDHPVVPMTVQDLLGQRIVEYVVHTWDVLQAIGDPTPLDTSLARRAWQLAAPLAPIAGQLGVFGDGPSGLVSEDAGDEARLLDVTGRVPRARDESDSSGGGSC